MPFARIATIVLALAAALCAQTNPVPFLNNPLVPASVAPGGPSFTLTVNGTGFVPGSVVNWNGSPLATTYVSGSQVTAVVPAGNIAMVDTACVTVSNPGVGASSNVDLLTVRTEFTQASFTLATTLNSVGGEPSQVIAADLNHDGHQDLISTSGFPNNKVWVSLGNGDGTFQTAVGYDAGPNNAFAVLADFNNDGILDLAASGDGSISILLGNGDGTFQPYSSAPGDSQGPFLVAGDFNGDGNQDLATNGYPSSVKILLGNGDGTFQNPNSYQISSNAGTYLTVGDLNGDGKLDLAITVEVDHSVAILLGNGDGSFQAATEINLIYLTGELTVADLNGDGKLDLAAYVAGAQGEVAVMLGNGDGTFQPPVYYQVGGITVISGLGIADLNGDGILDLVADAAKGALSQTPENSLATYMGHGNGTYSNLGFFAIGNLPVSVGIADFNQDGMLDAATANYADNSLSVLLQVSAVLSRTNIIFPKTKVGQISTKNVTLSNIGSQSIAITKFSFNGNGTSSFSQTNTCGRTLAAGASCTIMITFSPTEFRRFVAVSLQIEDSAVNGRQVVYLKANLQH